MERKLVLTSIIMILLTSLLGVTIRVERVQASGTIYIRADGSIDPPTANIATIDNVTYIFTGNNYDSIVVERNNIVVDGAGYALQGTEAYQSKGIDATTRSNVTIKNMEIEMFYFGIWLWDSLGNTISGNTITNNNYDGVHLESSSNNTVSGNTITNNNWYGVLLFFLANYNIVSGNNITSNNDEGVYLFYSSNNTVSGNTITANNGYGVYLEVSSNHNTVSGNNITNNEYGVYLYQASNNIIYHNNIVNNTQQTYIVDSTNVWDNGCEGNFWSDYNGTDSDGDGIGDTPYIIDGSNQDNYPLMNPYWNPADINHDLKVDIFDVVLACVAYSSTPSDLNWNCHSDITEPYEVIDIFDIVMICSSYGEEY